MGAGTAYVEWGGLPDNDSGSRVIHVCPGFAQLQSRDPERSAYLIIHESLHALGLGEDPPSSSEITHRVERRCWKAASLAAK